MRRYFCLAIYVVLATVYLSFAACYSSIGGFCIAATIAAVLFVLIALGAKGL